MIVLAVAQGCEIWLAHDDHFIRCNQRFAEPSGSTHAVNPAPETAHSGGRLRSRREGLIRNIHDLANRGRRREQGQPVTDLGQQALDHRIIGPLWRQQSIGDRLRRFLIEIERCRPERQVEIDQRRVDLGVLSQAQARL
jgi:hypothetical protein